MSEKGTKSTPKKTKAKAKPKYVHINEFIAKKGQDLSSDIVEGFKVYMRGRTYMHSMRDFEKALKEFYNRKI